LGSAFHQWRTKAFPLISKSAEQSTESHYFKPVDLRLLKIMENRALLQ
jgi:hypothetical protein